MAWLHSRPPRHALCLPAARRPQIAQLALKHRQNKNQRQRIVIFIGSPIVEDKVGGAGRCCCRCCF